MATKNLSIRLIVRANRRDPQFDQARLRVIRRTNPNIGCHRNASHLRTECNRPHDCEPNIPDIEESRDVVGCKQKQSLFHNLSIYDENGASSRQWNPLVLAISTAIAGPWTLRAR